MKIEKVSKQAINQLLAKAKTLPVGTSITAYQLFTATFPQEKPDHYNMLAMAIYLENHAKDAGLYFDSSHHFGLCEGLPQNLDFIIRQRKPSVPFDQINYIECASPGPKENLIINLPKKNICSFETGIPFSEPPLQYKCTKDQWEDIADLIKCCNFDQWEKDYRPSERILDGRQWEIKLKKNGKTSKKIYGSNAYPNAWRIFWALKQMCFRLLKHESLFFSKPEKCPFCGSDAIKTYLYGIPTPNVFNLEKYIITRCCFEKGMPKWGCTQCGAKFIEGDPIFDNHW